MVDLDAVQAHREIGLGVVDGEARHALKEYEGGIASDDEERGLDGELRARRVLLCAATCHSAKRFASATLPTPMDGSESEDCQV